MPWISYFDFVVVDAVKPVFFQEGTLLRQIDLVKQSSPLQYNLNGISMRLEVVSELLVVSFLLFLY